MTASEADGGGAGSEVEDAEVVVDVEVNAAESSDESEHAVNGHSTTARPARRLLIRPLCKVHLLANS